MEADKAVCRGQSAVGVSVRVARKACISQWLAGPYPRSRCVSLRSSQQPQALYC